MTKIYNVFGTSYDKTYSGDIYESCFILFSTLDKEKANEFIKKYNKTISNKDPMEIELQLKESESDVEIHDVLLSCANLEGSNQRLGL